MTDFGRMTRAAALLGSTYPIIQGGMTLVGTAGLAAAVSAAGGFGLVSAGRMSPEEFGREIEAAFALTIRPIGVNIPVTRDLDWMAGAVSAASRRAVRAIVLGGGNPAPWAEEILGAGKRLIAVVSGPRQAERAQKFGADAVVAEGNEAGGKNGFEEIGGLDLVPMVARAVDIPVFAAGGIVDGRTAAAAICLGAGGIQMGTRFLVSAESPVHPRTKEHLMAGKRETLLIGRRHRLNRRVLRNPASDDIAGREAGASLDEMLRLVAGERTWHGLRDGDVEQGMISVGQGIALIDDAPPVAEIIVSVMRDLNSALKAAAVEANGFSPPQSTGRNRVTGLNEGIA